jgi:hypothetical protein
LDLPQSLRLDRTSSLGTSRWALVWAAVVASAGAAAVGLVAGLALAPDATNRLRDDAFYEFVWAIRLATGDGPTVSDGTTTSGVQLLWSLLLVPWVWVCGAAALPVVAPWLGFALHVATAALWERSSRDRVVGFCIGACWLGQPLLVRECQNGQETALACLLASCLWLWRRAPERTFAVLAVLAVLARTDLWLVVVALSAWRHARAWPRALIAPTLAAGAIVATSVALGGGPMPDSALPMAWLWHANHAATSPTAADTAARAWWFLRPALLGGPWALASACGLGFALFLLVRPWWPAALRVVPALAVGIVCGLGARDLATPAWAAVLLALLPAQGPRRVPWALGALLLGLAGIVVLHWGVRWYPRDYYAAPLVVGAFAAIASHGRCRALLFVFALVQIADGARVRPEPLAAQREMTMAGRFLADVLPAGERVGCFNSGLVTFHAAVLAPPGRVRGVVNLDGVVDARAFAALRDARLGAWLDEQRVRFVLDNPLQFVRDPAVPHASGRWFGADFTPQRDLLEIARFDVPGVGIGRPGGDSVRLYWRVGRGAPPPRPTAMADLGIGEDGARYLLWPARAGETLALEDDGPGAGRRPWLVADVATTMVLRLPGPGRASFTVVVRGDGERVLELPPL